MSNLPALRLDAEEKKPAYEWPLEAFDWIIWRRIFAFGFDIFCIFLLNMLAYPIMAIGGFMTFGLLWLFKPILFLIILLSYHTLTIGSPRSATLGMRIMGVEIRTWEGERLNYARALLQTILFYSTSTFMTPLILMVAFFTKNRRTLHEILSGTVTIRACCGPAEENLTG
jgi:uncharacterized RDD family membrane protein YckC